MRALLGTKTAPTQHHTWLADQERLLLSACPSAALPLCDDLIYSSQGALLTTGTLFLQEAHALPEP